MSEQLHRRTDSLQAQTLQTDATSPVWDFQGYSGGMIFITGAITTLTWYVAPQVMTDPSSAEMKRGTLLPANNQTAGASTQTVVQGQAYQIPVELFGAPFVQCRANAPGLVDVSLKS